MPVVSSVRDGCVDFTSVTGKWKGRGGGVATGQAGREGESRHHKGAMLGCYNVTFDMRGLNLGLNPKAGSPHLCQAHCLRQETSAGRWVKSES